MRLDNRMIAFLALAVAGAGGAWWLLRGRQAALTPPPAPAPTPRSGTVRAGNN